MSAWRALTPIGDPGDCYVSNRLNVTNCSSRSMPPVGPPPPTSTMSNLGALATSSPHGTGTVIVSVKLQR
jgi:hypothetical protein